MTMGRLFLLASLLVLGHAGNSTKHEKTKDAPAPAPAGKRGEAILFDGKVRVQALSPRLVRVEPAGEWGFEDRSTFVVQNRDFEGVDVTIKEGKDSTEVHTDHYTVVVNSGGGFTIWSPKGDKLYDSEEDDREGKNLMFWPSPNSASSYAIEDSPRFAIPEWTVSPPSEDVDIPEHLQETNGYDFGNNVAGDTYVFLLGFGVDEWTDARSDFMKLSGPVPLLPDYAYGTWFTWWHPYDEGEAKGEIQRWFDAKIPIDVWGLDMNWRLATGGQDTTYDHPNETAFPDYEEWFKYIKDFGLHTYFNDHPMPQAPQCSPDEVGFRWNGLTQWLDKGLTFWWFDHNWKFTIPPPTFGVNSDKENTWDGLSNTVWGSHVFFEITKRFGQNSRQEDKEWWGGRPISLTKFAMPDWVAGTDPTEHAEIAGHHRYPVWWTGDDVTLRGAVETTVDCGVHDMKPYVHSDCGGFGWFTDGDLMRWTAHCTFGTIYRNHGANHQPWIYGDWWQEQIAKYMRLRYRFSPTLIAGGQRATRTGFPIVARGDLYWPESWEDSNSNSQYIWMDDVLVAPIFDSTENMTSRKVWIPPGDWQDVWNGDILTGPQVIEAWQPWRRQPMWHRRDGAMMVMTDEQEPGLRIAWQDWSSLTLDCFPAYNKTTTERTVYEKSTEDDPDAVPKTDLSMSTDGKGKVTWKIGKSPVSRAWKIRINLHPNQHVTKVTVDGKDKDFETTLPRDWDDGTDFWEFFPFDEIVASRAGNRVDFRVPVGQDKRTIVAVIAEGKHEENKKSHDKNASVVDNKEEDAEASKHDKKEHKKDSKEIVRKFSQQGTLFAGSSRSLIPACVAGLVSAGLIAAAALRERRVARQVAREHALLELQGTDGGETSDGATP